MILTCPECASRYFVDDASIGPDGRKVRCANCGHAWREPSPRAAMAAPEPDFTPPTPPPVMQIEEMERPAGRIRADISARLREEAVEKRKTREAAAVGAIWAVLGVGFCAIVVGAVVFRADVVRLAPSTAGAYAFARMPVNPTGLAIEQANGKPALKDGHTALNVEGVLRNVETHPRDVTPLRVRIVDKAGKTLVNQVAIPPGGAIQPGEARPFSISIQDPPLQFESALVEFAFDQIKPRPVPAHRPLPEKPAAPPPSVAMKLRGSAPAPDAPSLTPKPAAAVPASSPYALPPAAAPAHG